MKRIMLVMLAVSLCGGCANCPTHPWLSRLFRRDCPPVLETPPTTSLIVPPPTMPETPLPPPRISEIAPAPRLAPEHPAPPNHQQP